MDLISTHEKREELQRILQTRPFARAEKKARFLEFVTDQTLRGNADKLNEYVIGIEIYERGKEFDPQVDPIVRVQAHQIRGLLQKYYEGDGKEHPLRLELPAGHYIPEFRRITPPESGVEPAAASPARRSGWTDPRNVLLVILVIACTSLATLWYRAREPGSRSRAPLSAAFSSDLQWFWQPFLPPARSPLIVIPVHPLLRAAHGGDSAKTLSNGRLIPKESLPEFLDTIHFRELEKFYFVPSTTDFTAVGETIGLVRLLDLLGKVNQAPQVMPSRLVDFEEIKSRNTILLGGNQAWSGRIFVDPEGFYFYRGVIRNKNPRTGEQPVYKPEFDPITNNLTRDYALIVMLPNEKKDERILLIYGIYTQGSQAAIEYVTAVEHLAELRQALIAESPDKKTIPRLFQALIETTVENWVPGKSKLIGVRAVPDPS